MIARDINPPLGLLVEMDFSSSSIATAYDNALKNGGRQEKIVVESRKHYCSN